MASRRASAPCRSDIYVRMCPEKRLQNACREFCSALLMSGLESIGCTKGRQRLARVSQRSVRDPPMLPSYWLDGPRLMASKTAAMTGSRLAK